MMEQKMAYRRSYGRRTTGYRSYGRPMYRGRSAYRSYGKPRGGYRRGYSRRVTVGGRRW